MSHKWCIIRPKRNLNTKVDTVVTLITYTSTPCHPNCCHDNHITVDTIATLNRIHQYSLKKAVFWFMVIFFYYLQRIEWSMEGLHSAGRNIWLIPNNDFKNELSVRIWFYWNILIHHSSRTDNSSHHWNGMLMHKNKVFNKNLLFWVLVMASFLWWIVPIQLKRSNFAQLNTLFPFNWTRYTILKTEPPTRNFKQGKTWNL